MPVSAQTKAPPGSWTAAKSSQAKHHVVLGLSALRRKLKRQVSQCGFFHSNSNF